MTRMMTRLPARKVVAGSLAGALTTIAVYLANKYLLTDPLPAEVTGALTTVMMALVGYGVPPARRDQIVIDGPPNTAKAPGPSGTGGRP